MKSGITGWSQVHSVLKNIPKRKMSELDSYYLTHWSLVFDLKIVLMTVVCVLTNPTAQLDRS